MRVIRSAAPSSWGWLYFWWEYAVNEVYITSRNRNTECKPLLDKAAADIESWLVTDGIGPLPWRCGTHFEDEFTLGVRGIPSVFDELMDCDIEFNLWKEEIRITISDSDYTYRKLVLDRNGTDT